MMVKVHLRFEVTLTPHHLFRWGLQTATDVAPLIAISYVDGPLWRHRLSHDLSWRDVWVDRRAFSICVHVLLLILFEGFPLVPYVTVRFQWRLITRNLGFGWSGAVKACTRLSLGFKLAIGVPVKYLFGLFSNRLLFRRNKLSQILSAVLLGPSWQRVIIRSSIVHLVIRIFD